jgi:hypothetical protein
VFADYEILQPFPQLGREVFAVSEQDAAADQLSRFIGRQVPATKVLGLERRGWRRGAAQDAGIQAWMERDLPDGYTVSVGLDPGIAVGYVTMFPEQKLEGIQVDRGRSTYYYARDRTARLRDLDPVTISEIIRDLEEVIA